MTEYTLFQPKACNVYTLVACVFVISTTIRHRKSNCTAIAISSTLNNEISSFMHMITTCKVQVNNCIYIQQYLSPVAVKHVLVLYIMNLHSASVVFVWLGNKPICVSSISC